MPMRPKPTALRVIEGNRGGRPLPKHEPKPRRGLPPAPPHLDTRARAEWNRLVPELHSIGMLTVIDGGVLAAYCMAYSRWIEAEDAIARMKERDQLTGALMIKTTNGNAIQNPLVGTAHKAMLLMCRFAVEYGLTPAARANVEARPYDDDEGDGPEKYF
ncbi:phage terminase small subunit P27 family [Burkholderia sp. JPY481]